MPNKGEMLWGWRYQGGGFYPNVPARDVSADEARERGLSEALDASPLHRREFVTEKEQDNGGR